MQLASPWALLALLLIPVLLYVRLRQQREETIRFSDIRLVAAAGSSWRQRLRQVPLTLRILALVLIVIALARPQQGMEKVYDVSKGIAIEMVVDRSGSMGTGMAFSGRESNRLEVVKQVFTQFVNGNGKELAGRPSDLIGMITFARYADTNCPLTLAHDTLPGFLSAVQVVDQRNEDGTAIGDAVALAAARLHTAAETLARQKGASGAVYEIKSKISDQSRLRGAFTKKEQVAEFLRMIKEKELGISVIISGLLDETLEACQEAGLTPHTINFSLGVWGKKELLPSDDVLAITTMCGHHMIPPGLVEEVMEQVKKGKMSPQEGGLKLALCCPCGIFNQVRAAKLLKP